MGKKRETWTGGTCRGYIILLPWGWISILYRSINQSNERRNLRVTKKRLKTKKYEDKKKVKIKKKRKKEYMKVND